MTLKDAYRETYVACAMKGYKIELDGHYRSVFDFGDKDYYVDPDGNPIWNLKFKIGVMKTGKNGVYFHKDKFPVFGRVVNAQSFLFKYGLFLKADGISEPVLLRCYLMKCLLDKCEFWRKKAPKYEEWEQYEPTFEECRGVIDRVVEYAYKKHITDTIRESFGYQCSGVVNYNRKGSKKARFEVILEAGREAKKNRTDKRIREMHNPDLTDKENAFICDVSLRRFQMWKKDNVENLRDRLKRLYDPSKSLNENMTICGCSKPTIILWKKFLEETNPSKMKDDEWADYFFKKEMEEDKKDRTHRKKRKDIDPFLDDITDWLDKMDFDKD